MTVSNKSQGTKRKEIIEILPHEERKMKVIACIKLIDDERKVEDRNQQQQHSVSHFQADGKNRYCVMREEDKKRQG